MYFYKSFLRLLKVWKYFIESTNILVGPVTNADSHKILRPTHFSCTKNIKADSFLALINIKANMKKVNNKAKNWQKPDKY
jgi:hypothetical protein